MPFKAIIAAGPAPSGVTIHNPIVVSGPISSANSRLSALASPNAIVAPFTPAQIRKAYGLDQIVINGTGKTIAIVDAYGSPTAAADLVFFDTQMGLPAANLTIHNMNGVPALNTNWDRNFSGYTMGTCYCTRS